jgi:hypothetical protein
MKERAASLLKKPHLPGNMSLEPPRMQRSDHFLKVSGNRKHEAGFLSLIADKCPSPQLMQKVNVA